MAIELLSPAGDYEKLKTAFSYGADAAYMGMTEFSLRRNAGNFSQEEIEKVRDLKEKTGKHLYCTMNILFHQRDMERIQSMADEIRAWPFDAFIISDIGLVPFLQRNFPDRALHLSTQASCLNSESVRMYRSMGFSRVILGREASSSMARCAWPTPDAASFLPIWQAEAATKVTARIHAAGITALHWRKRKDRGSTIPSASRMDTRRSSPPRICA